jgi:membrane fusion protein, heavy metal efflux system
MNPLPWSPTQSWNSAWRLLGLTIPAVALLAGCHPVTDTKDSGDPKVEGQALIFPTNSPQLRLLKVEAATAPQAPAARFPGRVVWDDNVTTRVYSPLAGRVTRVLADAATEVSINACLALIASPDFGQAQADAHRAETDLVLADRNLARLRDLFEHGAAAQKDLQGAEADQARAQAEKQRAEARLKLYGSAENGVDQLYRLTSPVAGVVVERNLNPGQEVRPDTMLANSDKLAAPLFVITDPAQIWVLVDVAEQDLSIFKPGLKATIRSRAFPAEVFRGQVDLVSDQIQVATRMVPVRLSVANPQRRLKSEMLVSVELEPTLAAGLEVPTRAVFLKGDQHFVFRDEGGGKFTRQRVMIGTEHEGKMLVLEGVQPGQRVVSDGSLLLEQILASE